MQQLLLQLIVTHNTAAVLITHDIDEALLLSDRVLLLGNHPAHILGQWHIDLPQPRTQRVEELGALRIDILKTLRRASRTAALSPTSLPSEPAHVHG
jgi:NitT/TauT family transport system ATP-binding protein